MAGSELITEGGVPHKLFHEPLKVLVKFYKEHLQRDMKAGRLVPPTYPHPLRA